MTVGRVELGNLQDITSWAEERNVNVLGITDEPPSASLERFLQERALTFAVYHDSYGEAQQAFNSWGTPLYYVLDDAGNIKFERSRLVDVRRQLLVLGEPNTTTNGR